MKPKRKFSYCKFVLRKEGRSTAGSIPAESVGNVYASLPVTDRLVAKLAQDSLTVLVVVHRRFFQPVLSFTLLQHLVVS